MIHCTAWRAVRSLVCLGVSIKHGPDRTTARTRKFTDLAKPVATVRGALDANVTGWFVLGLKANIVAKDAQSLLHSCIAAGESIGQALGFLIVCV